MPAQFIVALVALGGSLAVLAGLIAYRVLTPFTGERQRIEAVLHPAAAGSAAVQVAQLTERVDPLWERVSRVVPKSPKDMGRLRRRMAVAGYRDASAAIIYSICELALPILAAGLVLLVRGPHAPYALLSAGFAGLIAYFIPGLFLEHRIRARQREIRNGLPDVLDLLIVCLEAGSSMDQAIVKATDELELAYPALAEELRILTTETRAGKPRIEAFKNLADRTKVDDVRALDAMLLQTDRFGTSVAQALRTFAETSRTKRRQRAEERAAKVGVKLVFPLVLLLFPAFYVVTLGPAIIQFVRVFFGQVVQQVR
jgi:tight adherence protein C